MSIDKRKTIQRGDVSIQEQPGSPVIAEVRGVVTMTRTFKGLFTDLIERRPRTGDVLTGYDNLGRLLVKEVSIAHGVGDTGGMTVKYEPAEGGSSAGESAEGEVSIAFEAVEKPLLTHPYFEKADAGIVEAWRKASPDMAAQFMYEDKDGKPVELPPLERMVAEKMAKGVESWILFAPVVKLTSTHAQRPPGVGAANGLRQRPPVHVDGDWEFLRQGDNLNRDAQGVWTLERSWQGAHEWDEILYLQGEG